MVLAQPPPGLLQRWRRGVGCPQRNPSSPFFTLPPLQQLWQTSGYPAGDALMLRPVACFVFVLFRTALSVSGARPFAALLCFLLLQCCSSLLSCLFRGLFSLLRLLLLACLGIRFCTFESSLRIKYPLSVDLTVSACLLTLTCVCSLSRLPHPASAPKSPLCCKVHIIPSS